jgi:hypothetical protein
MVHAWHGMDHAKVVKLGAGLTGATIKGILPGVAHLVFADLAAARQVQLRERLPAEGLKSLESVADVTAGMWLDSMRVYSNCVSGHGDVVSSLRYTLRVRPAAMQDRPLMNVRRN